MLIWTPLPPEPSFLMKGLANRQSHTPILPPDIGDGPSDPMPSWSQAVIQHATEDAFPSVLVPVSLQPINKPPLQDPDSDTRTCNSTSVANLYVGNPFYPLQFTTQVMTDASPTDWGTHCNNHKVHALWSKRGRKLYRHHLELLVVIKAFCALQCLPLGRGVQAAT